MKVCSKCQHSGISETENYCPNCGSRDLLSVSAGLPNGVIHPERLRRIGAFVIDAVLIFVVSALSSFPFLGIIPAIVVTLYQLLRDFSGASFGKRILRLKVVSSGGGRASAMQYIGRNIIFVIPSLALFLTALGIPGVGFLIDGSILLLIYFVEFISLMATGKRVGDMIAGTTVVNA